MGSLYLHPLQAVWAGWPYFFTLKEQAIQKLPPSVDELIDELDQMVPEMIPSTDATLIEVQRQAGKRELVIFLKKLRDRKNSVTPAPTRRKR